MINTLPRVSQKSLHQSSLNVSFQPIFASRPTNTQPLLPVPGWALLSPSPWHPSTTNQIQLHFWNWFFLMKPLLDSSSPVAPNLLINLVLSRNIFIHVTHPLPAIFMLCLCNCIPKAPMRATVSYTSSRGKQELHFRYSPSDLLSLYLHCSPLLSFLSWKSVFKQIQIIEDYHLFKAQASA